MLFEVFDLLSQEKIKKAPQQPQQQAKTGNVGNQNKQEDAHNRSYIEAMESINLSVPSLNSGSLEEMKGDSKKRKMKGLLTNPYIKKRKVQGAKF